jgi:hypothetical protein
MKLLHLRKSNVDDVALYQGTTLVVPLEFLHFLSGCCCSKYLRRGVQAERAE